MEHEIRSLFDLSHTMAGEYLAAFVYPWEALDGLGEFLRELSRRLPADFYEMERGVFIHGTAKIARTAELHPPCIICANAQLRSGAYVRGSVLIGERCVVGNSTELKNCILFDSVKVPHFNYVGDSILGYGAHLGAGAICANVRLDGGEVLVRDGNFATGRKKVGAFVGDLAEVGCNSVLFPGATVPRFAKLPPLSSVRS